MEGMRLLPIVIAATALATAGCKIQPIDNNASAMPWHLMPQVNEYTGDAAATLGEDTETPAPSDAPEGLGPAARETIKYLPLGHDKPNRKQGRPGEDAASLYQEEVKIPDRWRIGFPAWERGSQSDSPWDMSAWWDPYHQNWLKGDYPIPGTQNTFLSVEATSITRYEDRKLPTPSGVFPRNGGSGAFFGSGNQTLLEETMLVTVDLFQGETAFKPVDWRLFVRGAFNWNKTRVRERQAVYADPSRGRTRDDDHATLQQYFFETTLAAINRRYDVVQMRVGTQLFNSDFKGFMFFDESLGVRLFGSLDNNRWQWNIGYFSRFNKDTNSSLNTFDSIKQDVFIANIYRQDVLEYLLPDWASRSWSHGLTTSLSYHYFTDEDSVHYDENGFLVRPRAIGVPAPNHRSINYLGWTNDGHVGRLNITSALYYADGYESLNEIAGKRQDVSAMLAALELSVDIDWMRLRAQGYYQSGDDDPTDKDAEGFDAIYDNVVFAGGEFGFWNRNGVRLTGSGVGLNQRFSLNNSLRSSKDEGAPSFVNPGLILGGVGFDAQLTPHLKLISNASYLRFDDTSSMELVLNQDAIGNEIGYDLSVGFLWRPLLTDNVILKGGYAALVPAGGFKDIYTSETLYSTFLELILTW
jgi:hypothetical protein